VSATAECVIPPPTAGHATAWPSGLQSKEVVSGACKGKRLLGTQFAGNAGVLPGLVNSEDGVCGISRSDSAFAVSPAVVSLCPAPLCQ
jgi:hypothetical protein